MAAEPDRHCGLGAHSRQLWEISPERLIYPETRPGVLSIDTADLVQRPRSAELKNSRGTQATSRDGPTMPRHTPDSSGSLRGPHIYPAPNREWLIPPDKPYHSIRGNCEAKDCILPVMGVDCYLHRDWGRLLSDSGVVIIRVTLSLG
ncbi:Hypothetical predicted protein [Pelobates cultripes]|uniref:Uncharacterized protein n=1 Tax=Pelobates cultripes TaxID=61616 RepID=A0AAD1SD38_PELCU|nr:Hypothetical predicted protein [Pelobates cultripes]